MDRRTILRAITGTAVGGVALQTGAGAQTQPDEPEHTHLKSQYDTVDTVLKVLREHAGTLLEELDDDDLIGSADASQLRAVRDNSDAVGDNESIRIMSTVDEKTQTPTAVIRVVEEFSEGEAAIFVLPEAGRSYATVEYDSGEKELRTTTLNANNESPDEVDPDCAYHDIHNYDSYQGTTTNCTSEVCNSGRDTCGSNLIGCEWEHYIRETYEVYECVEIDYCPGGEIPCSATTQELVSMVCTEQCCSDEGPGCGCDSNYGCP